LGAEVPVKGPTPKLPRIVIISNGMNYEIKEQSLVYQIFMRERYKLILMKCEITLGQNDIKELAFSIRAKR